MYCVKNWICVLLLAVLISVIFYLLLHVVTPCGSSWYNDNLLYRRDFMQSAAEHFSNIGVLSRFSPYHKNIPIIFIGGMPRTGTTLMRALLDAHPDVRCGEETRVIPKILRFSEYSKNANGASSDDTVVSSEAIDSAILAFILSIVTNHGPSAPRLCNKDPFTHRHTEYLHKLLPKSKFILMVRDGRATVHSIISRKITIKDFKMDDWRDIMQRWNRNMELMYGQCVRVGSEHCMPVFYEQLALHPEMWMKKILKFLDLPWNNSVLHHEDFIGKPGGISLSKVERSSDQIIKPINLEALTKWTGKIPKDVMDDLEQIAPMLSRLGYDPRANPPNYGQPDARIINNTILVRKNKQMWEEKIHDLNIHRIDGA